MLAMAYIGVGIWLWRLWPRPDNAYQHACEQGSGETPLVSIIVPARNEAENLPMLLNSLQDLDYPATEVIVVDDESTDRTYEVAAAFDVTVISGQSRPAGWAGKPWACHQGAQVAKGEYLLFTDADTWHSKTSLAQAVRFMKQEQADLASALPYHADRTLWAILMGPFQALLLALTAPFQPPRPKRLFAIGQYLLFRRDYYDLSGGHKVVHSYFAEDLALARHCLAIGRRYRLHWGQPWFHVTMYDTFPQFVAGWRRNFRLGMNGSSRWVFGEALLLMLALFGGGQWGQTIWAVLPTLLTLVIIARWQVTGGRFSILGVLLFPFGVAVFTWVSLAAAYDQLFNRQLVWKQRAYRRRQAL
jgi:glycosyltransferase involved in cell wall biosynthesis